MSKTIEQRCAAKLLETRDQGASVIGFVKGMLRYYFFTAVVFGTAAWFLIEWVKMPHLSLLLVGMYAGMIGKDLRDARAQARIWPIIGEVIDWSRVERMAAGEGIDPA